MIAKNHSECVNHQEVPEVAPLAQKFSRQNQCWPTVRVGDLYKNVLPYIPFVKRSYRQEISRGFGSA